jgi:hypothetical protein
VWDEFTGSHRLQLEAVDRSIRDVLDTDVPFGGIVVVLTGDFRQTLPIVKRGNHAETSATILKRSKQLWPHVRELRLIENERCKRLEREGKGDAAAKAKEFGAWLLDIGDGAKSLRAQEGEDAHHLVKLRPDIVFAPNCKTEKGEPDHNADLERLIDTVYPTEEFQRKSKLGSIDADWLRGRAILTPTNEEVDAGNTRVLKALPGEPRKLHSADTYDAEVDDKIWPIEYLNQLTLSGLPPHELVLKVGAVVMSLKNVNPREGIVNGTRMVVVDIKTRVLRCRLLDGKHKGQVRFIFRLRMSSTDGGVLPFTLYRLQFPIRLAYFITINKSQGQTMDNIGVYLPQPVFAHGQLYVALGRVGDAESIRVLVRDDNVHQGRGPKFGLPEGTYTSNVVYPEVLGESKHSVCGCCHGRGLLQPLPPVALPSSEYIHYKRRADAGSDISSRPPRKRQRVRKC